MLHIVAIVKMHCHETRRFINACVALEKKISQDRTQIVHDCRKRTDKTVWPFSVDRLARAAVAYLRFPARSRQMLFRLRTGLRRRSPRLRWRCRK